MVSLLGVTDDPLPLVPEIGTGGTEVVLRAGGGAGGRLEVGGAREVVFFVSGGGVLPRFVGAWRRIPPVFTSGSGRGWGTVFVGIVAVARVLGAGGKGGGGVCRTLAVSEVGSEGGAGVNDKAPRKDEGIGLVGADDQTAGEDESISTVPAKEPVAGIAKEVVLLIFLAASCFCINSAAVLGTSADGPTGWGVG